MTNLSTQFRSHVGPGAERDRPMVYVNGEMLPKSQACVNVFDHGLLYGDGVFEGIRVYRGRIFKCEQHMDRLWASAEALRITVPVTRAEMIDIQRRCIEANEITDGYIRLLVTRGVGTLGLNPFKCPTAGVICICDQIELYTAEMYQNGMRVVVANRPKTPIACLDPRIKSLNYLNNILAKVEAIDHGCLEVIMLNTEGKLTEGSGDNLFVIKHGELFTPPVECGLLEGITRRFVMRELCPALGLRCTERVMELDDVLGADELFMTGTAAEMIAITQVDTQTPEGKIARAHKISEGEGPITKRLRAEFRRVVTGPDVPED